MKKVKLMIVLAVVFIMSVTASAEDLQPIDVAAQLQGSYEKTSSLQADFVQLTYSRMSRRKKSGSGTVALVKPGLMRWDYLEPDKQVMVCDGKTISMYFSKEEQMVVTDAKQYLESDVTYSFFAGSGNIVRDFDIMAPTVDERDPVPGSNQIKIFPKKGHAQVDFIDVWVGSTSHVLTRIKITDKFGSITDIRFANIRRNEKVDKALFSYIPPDGTEIIEQ